MTASFCMYGNQLNVYEFLEQANNFPADYSLWEDVEVMKDEEPGFTLHFNNKKNSTCLFALIKFILSNKTLIKNEIFSDKKIIKEISIEFEKNEIAYQYKFNKQATYVFNPGIMKLLGELNIKVCITKNTANDK